MAYDPTKDKVLKTWRISVTDKETAIVSVASYNNGDPKIAISTTEIEKENGEMVHGRIKRWGWGEALKLREALDEAIEIMDKLAAGKKSTV